ncbi:MAG TPA: polysaccharide biosynthesis protein, partial [Blastocatellia bacterium]|nr:polysaccharide biosynthesis protein [Blastocatellia bacterium]
MRHLPFQLQKLLTNPPIPLDHNRAEATIRRKSVLVTGAGGSIASSLCRRIKQFGPKTLILLEQSENNLYQIDLDLSADQSGVRLVPVLGDAGDLGLLDNVFDAYQPDLIFHTAAYKHVPLLERQPLAAIMNNVLGTYNLVNSAIQRRIPRLIMLSTDKAVNPASIMGASKRVAELMMLGLNSRQCLLTSVRLGNVLGSQGSVVPRFEEQIRRREPVTVTHPDAARFFMTADDAVELVLAAWLGTGGDILVPDLGEPVRIIDLANTMIDAAAVDPGSQPPITFTGL